LRGIKARVQMIEVLDLRRLPRKVGPLVEHALQYRILQRPIEPRGERFEITGLELEQCVFPQREYLGRAWHRSLATPAVAETFRRLKKLELKFDRSDLFTRSQRRPSLKGWIVTPREHRFDRIIQEQIDVHLFGFDHR